MYLILAAKLILATEKTHSTRFTRIKLVIDRYYQSQTALSKDDILDFLVIQNIPLSNFTSHGGLDHSLIQRETQEIWLL